MGEGSVAVDLFNPGQVLACLGLMEAAEVFFGDVRAGFFWEGSEARFELEAASVGDPIVAVIAFLKTAKATALVPAGCEAVTAEWNVDSEEVPQGSPLPYPDSRSQDKYPVRLSGHLGARSERNASITVDHWGDKFEATGRDPFKLWAGSGGLPGAARAARSLLLLEPANVSEPFLFCAPQSNAFRLDWRRDAVAIDAGFSANAQKSHLTMVGYPLVELLAAIGLTYARPVREEKLVYRYGVIGGKRYAPSYVRAALGGAELPFLSRSFQLYLAGIDADARERCITETIEVERRNR